MKGDILNRFILGGILICLIVIAFKTGSNKNVPIPTPNVSVNNQGESIVQIAPNRIGVVDTGGNSGWHQLVIFEYHPEPKKFEEVSSLPYEDIFNHPKENDIPTRYQKYGK